MNAILEIHYLPCIQYFSKLYLYDTLIIDDESPFEKQSYRNRCTIAGANGVIDLIIPVHQSRKKIPVAEMLIDNHSHWQRQHWQSIRSAYGKTPFFEHYAYRLEIFYQKPVDSLFEFNLQLMETLLGILKINPDRMALLSESGELSATEKNELTDLRNTIHPKQKYHIADPEFQFRHYIQAFEEKLGFIPNLSIIDLIFNAGPDAGRLLK
jgi:hypothetical protein